MSNGPADRAMNRRLAQLEALAQALAGGVRVVVAAEDREPPRRWQVDGPPFENGIAVVVGTSGSTSASCRPALSTAW